MVSSLVGLVVAAEMAVAVALAAAVVGPAVVAAPAVWVSAVPVERAPAPMFLPRPSYLATGVTPAPS